MSSLFKRPKYSLFAAFFTAAGAAAVLLPAPFWLGAILGLVYLLGNGHLLGRKAFPGETRVWQTFLGAIGVWAAVTVAASAVYYAYRLDAAMAFLVVSAVPAFLALVPARENAPSLRFSGEDARERSAAGTTMSAPARAALSLCAIVAVVALTAYGWDLLASAASTQTMRSPWDVVPRSFFIVAFLTALIAFVSAYGGLAFAGLVGTTALVVLASSVAALVYGIGFGFDPFIHRATEAVILETGAIEPKPFYYIGQYVTVTLAARILGIGVAAIDIRLMAVFLAALVPCAYWGMRRGFRVSPGLAAASTFGIVALPLSSFAATTPQGLANALLLMTAFIAPAFAAGAAPAWFVLLLAAAATSVHPLAGVPLLVFTVILLFVNASERLTAGRGAARWLLFAKLVALGSVALPAVFVLNSAVSGSAGVEVGTSSLGGPLAILRALVGEDVSTRQFSPTLDFTYAWHAVRTLVIAVAGVLGLWLMRERAAKAAMALGGGALAFFLNFVLLKTIVDFPFLIDYERSNYADRMADLTLFLLAPAALYAFGRFLARVRRIGFPAMGVAIAALVAAIAVSSIYLAYPRRDRYESSRGWSTGAADIEAVTAINKDAAGTPYVALANQSVSAAAIDRFGFKKYYPSNDPDDRSPVFFYPVPTGGPLYTIFLDMNETLGDRDTAERAMDLAGVDVVYYAVNHYWWQAQRIIATAQREADAWWTVDDRVWVFKYER